MLACAAMATSPRDLPDCAATAPAPDALSHLDEQGHARMVEVGSKSESQRLAVATGRVYLQATTLSRILAGELPKGDVLQVARIAGITAVKRTADLIPLCHPLRITGVKLHFTPQQLQPTMPLPPPKKAPSYISAPRSAPLIAPGSRWKR